MKDSPIRMSCNNSVQGDKDVHNLVLFWLRHYTNCTGERLAETIYPEGTPDCESGLSGWSRNPSSAKADIIPVSVDD